MNERTREEVTESLYSLAQKLKIIPANFSRYDFKARFFYFFIERDHKYSQQRFTEYLFDEKEPNYSQAMFIAFENMFQKLIAHQELSLELITELHKISTEGVLKPNMIKYRDQRSVVGFFPRRTSLPFLRKIAADNYEAKLDLIEHSAGKYSPAFSPDPLSIIYDVGIKEYMSPTDVVSLEKVINELIECYKNELQKIKEDTSISAVEKIHQKINLIGFFIGDMDRLHPYRDGNGRLDDFLLANYLLIQEGMSPCIIFQPWHFGYLNAKERFFAIIEGQIAYQYYFLGGNKITDSYGLSLREPLTEEMKSIPIKPPKSIYKTIIKITDTFLLYTQILAAESLNQDPDFSPKIDITKLRESLGEAITFLTQDPNNIKELDSFCLPVLYSSIISNITLAGALSFFDRDTTSLGEYVRHSVLQHHCEFDIEKYRTDPEYKASTLKKCLSRNLNNPYQHSLFLDYASDLDYQNNEKVRNGILLSLKEHIENESGAAKELLPENLKAVLEYIESELLRPAILEDINFAHKVRYGLKDLILCLDLRGYKNEHIGCKLSDGLEGAIIEKHPDLEDKIKAHFQSVRDLELLLNHPKSDDPLSFDSGLSFAAVVEFIETHCLEMLKPKTNPTPNLGTAASPETKTPELQH
ncbi:MAG: hypothetical protein V4612_00895 [Pseudomonadota bacterium]